MAPEFAKDISKNMYENTFVLNAQGHRRLPEKILKELNDNAVW